MTEHGHNFIREIAEAYRALEAEEGHLGNIARLEKQRIIDGETIARLELRVMEMKANEDQLQARIRSLEVERDDAGFRLLEAEDRLDAIRNAIGMPEAIANAIAKATKPEPTVEPVAQPTPAEPLMDQSPGFAAMVRERVADPITAPIQSLQGPNTEATHSAASLAEPSLTEGQSAVDPTVSMISTQSGPVSSENVEIKGDASSSNKYLGKRYYDWEYYVPLSSWLAGGGTEADYNWRPEARTAY